MTKKLLAVQIEATTSGEPWHVIARGVWEQETQLLRTHGDTVPDKAISDLLRMDKNEFETGKSYAWAGETHYRMIF